MCCIYTADGQRTPRTQEEIGRKKVKTDSQYGAHDCFPVVQAPGGPVWG